MSQSSRGLGQSGVMIAPVRWDAWPRLWGLCSAKAKQKPIDVYPPLGEKRCHLPSVYRHHFPTYLSFFPVTSLLPPRGRGSLEFGIGGPALKCPLPFSQVCTLGCPLLLPLSWCLWSEIQRPGSLTDVEGTQGGAVPLNGFRSLLCPSWPPLNTTRAGCMAREQGSCQEAGGAARCTSHIHQHLPTAPYTPLWDN